MDLESSTQELESESVPGVFTHNKPLGILNSNYQNDVNHNFTNENKSSLFSTKQRLKSRRYNLCYRVETTLKVSIFFIALLVAFN